MASHVIDPYVILDVRRAADRSLLLDYADSAGLSLRGRRPDDPEMLAALRSFAAAAPPQAGSHFTGPSPVAVFCRGEIGEELLRDLEDLFAAQGVPRDVMQLVAMPDGSASELLPFQLPLEVATIGAAAAGMVSLSGHSWAALPEVRRYGLTVSALPHLPRSRKNDLPDILVLTKASVADQLTSWDESKRPRLVIAIGFTPVIAEARHSGHAWIVFPHRASATAAVIDEIIFAIIHDRALHDVMKTVLRRTGGALRAFLIADPASNENLRMWDAIIRVAEKAIEIETRISWTGVGLRRLLARAKNQPPGPRAFKFNPAYPPVAVRAKAHAMVQSLETLRGSIGREGDAIVPAAAVLARAAAIERTAGKSERIIVKAAKNPKIAAALAEVPRRVDVALMRKSPRTWSTVFVARRETLAAATPYRLRVHVGRRSAVSIVTGDVPAVDPLLPPARDECGHLLQVALFPLDFQGEPQLQPLRLPPGRSTEPLYFDVVTPPAPLERARLRIAVYYDGDEARGELGADCYRNHLVQSFLLTTRIDALEGLAEEETTAVTLEFSRTSSFTNFEAFGGRALSLAVNQAPGGTHTLMLKRGAEAASVGVSQKFLQDQMDAVRAALWSASSADGKTPCFTTGESGEEKAFDDAVRDLAKKGRELRQRFFGSDDGSSSVQNLFRAIRDRVDATVQIVRLEQDFYFPWALLYDYPVPPVITGAPESPVCKEFRRKNPEGTSYSAEQCVHQCVYPDKKKAYCPYGFWGMRLQVEQTLHRLKKEDDAAPLLRPIGDGAVLVVTALDTDSARDFPNELRNAVGVETLVAEMAAGEKLLAKLWAADRPAIAVILGHYQTMPRPGQRNAPRIAVPGGEWLIADDVLQQVEDADVWQDPHTVVILAACESAGEDLVKMNGFITAFAGARAGAVLGTEASVFESLARRFGKSITASLVSGQSLGKAVVGFRRNLLQELNPLGLVFTAFGDADLHRAGENS